MADKSTEKETQVPRKKGGGDGKSKGPESKPRPTSTTKETSSAEDASDSGMRSRKITTSRG
jgi:hypothetical protein